MYDKDAPFTGILFAIATNVLIYALTKIHGVSSPHLSKAYADDIGLVLQEAFRDWSKFAEISRRFLQGVGDVLEACKMCLGGARHVG